MGYPASLSGNGVVLVTSTVTGALNSGAEQKLDVALGLPCNLAVKELANAFQLRAASGLNANGRPAYKLQTSASVDLKMEMTFLQNGINEGATVKLVPAP